MHALGRMYSLMNLYLIYWSVSEVSSFLFYIIYLEIELIIRILRAVIQDNRCWAFLQYDLKQAVKPLTWQWEPLEHTLCRRNGRADPKYIGQQDKWLHFQTSTSGRGKKGRGQGGRIAHGRRGSGIWNSYLSHINNLNNKSKGLCSALGNHVFDYGHKGDADQMRATWDNIVNHVGMIYGHNLGNELQNKKRIEILQPEHTHQVKDKHLKRVERIRDHH